jgi:hypothetical protein
MRRVTIDDPTATGDAPTMLRDGPEIWGVLAPGTLEDAADATVRPDGPRLVVVSARPVTDAESAFAGWSGAGWRAFESGVAALLESADRPLVVWPRAGSVLSDAVSTLSFARKHAGVGLLIDPVAWLTPAMEPDAPDHLARFAQALTLCETVVGVVVRPGAGLDASAVAGPLRPLLDRVGVAVGRASDLDAALGG